MKHATTCKFCKKPLILTIDDAYAELGDPLKIIGLAACNPCADLRVKLRKCHEWIGELCYNLIQWTNSKDKDDARAATKEGLLTATRKYSYLVAEIFEKPTAIWDPEFANLLFDRPERWGEILHKYKADCARS